MAGKCNLVCGCEYDGYCCLECPGREHCNEQCDQLDKYKFIENCPQYIKESEE